MNVNICCCFSHSMSSRLKRCAAMENSCAQSPETAPTTATRTGKSACWLRYIKMEERLNQMSILKIPHTTPQRSNKFNQNTFFTGVTPYLIIPWVILDLVFFFFSFLKSVTKAPPSVVNVLLHLKMHPLQHSLVFAPPSVPKAVRFLNWTISVCS